MSNANTNKTAAADAGPKTFTLVKPYTFRGARYDSFTAREPKVRDLRSFLRTAEQDPILAIETVLADLFQVDQPVVADMSIRDFGICKAWFEKHLADLNAEAESE